MNLCQVLPSLGTLPCTCGIGPRSIRWPPIRILLHAGLFMIMSSVQNCMHKPNVVLVTRSIFWHNLSRSPAFPYFGIFEFQGWINPTYCLSNFTLWQLSLWNWASLHQIISNSAAFRFQFEFCTELHASTQPGIGHQINFLVQTFRVTSFSLIWYC